VHELLVWQQTTRHSAREIHDIGLRELARIRAEMEVVIRRIGRDGKFDGNFAAFIDFLNTDARFK
jgi:uncharacterized protein (DUF885 family)